MAVIQIPVETLDENCAGCQCMDLTKTELFADFQIVTAAYSCRNIHMCTYIRNRIIRNDDRIEKEKNQ